MKNQFSLIVLCLFFCVSTFNVHAGHIFLNGYNGSDTNTGTLPTTAVKTFAKAKSLISAGDTIFICGNVLISGIETWDLANYGTGGTGPGIVMRWVKGLVPGISTATYSRTSNSRDGLILVDGGDLTMTNIIVDGGNVETTSNYSNILCVTSSGSKATLSENCTLQNNIVKRDGGIVRIKDGGFLKMEKNAKVTNGTAWHYGGGIYIYKATVELTENSSVVGNTAERPTNIPAVGGGIYVNQSSLSIKDQVSISNNKASSHAGGIAITNSTVTMTNGTILNNTSDDRASGVYLYNNSMFTMDGGTISGNKSNTGSGVLMENSSTFMMNGGTISDNEALTMNGGGVRVYQQNRFIMNGGIITKNKAATNGGGVSLDWGASLTMNGGTITSNTATIYGGGVYVDSNSATRISLYGNPTVKGNTSTTPNALNPSDNDIYLPGDNLINVLDVLTGNGTIGVVVPDHHVAGYDFAKGMPFYTVTKMDAAAFFDDFADPLTLEIELNPTAPEPKLIRFRYTYTVTYYGNTNTEGTAPVDPTVYGQGDTAYVLNQSDLGKSGAVFYGWSITPVLSPITSDDDTVGIGSMSVGDTIIMKNDTTLYALWAVDLNSNNIPDYKEPHITLASENKWAEKEADKPKWNSQFDEDNKNAWYCGCDMVLTMNVSPDSNAERIINLNYLGALKKGFVVDEDGEVLADSYILAKGDSVFSLHISILEDKITSVNEGLTGAVETVIVGGGRDTSDWFNLYTNPIYENISVKPYLRSDKTVDFGITGGSPNLMRSINGHAWRNAYLPFTSIEQLCVTDGVSILLREPNGCWEAELSFMSYEAPTILRYVDIPKIEGVTTIPEAGRHYVEGHDDFSFTVSSANGTPLKVYAKGYYSGINKELIGQNMDNGTYKYTVVQITEPWSIIFEPYPTSGTVSNNMINKTSVWSYNNKLYVNTEVGTIVRIYNMSGSLCKQFTASGSSICGESLRSGVYVVAVGNIRYKVVIR